MDLLRLRLQEGLRVWLKVDTVGLTLGLFHVAGGGDGVLVSVTERVWVRVNPEGVGVRVKVPVTVQDSDTVVLSLRGGDLVGVGDSV